MGDSSYSFSLTTFNPTGKLLQIEHALKAVQNGKTSLGIQGMVCNLGGFEVHSKYPFLLFSHSLAPPPLSPFFLVCTTTARGN